jgi:hypothetical protein
MENFLSMAECADIAIEPDSIKECPDCVLRAMRAKIPSKPQEQEDLEEYDFRDMAESVAEHKETILFVHRKFAECPTSASPAIRKIATSRLLIALLSEDSPRLMRSLLMKEYIGFELATSTPVYDEEEIKRLEQEFLKDHPVSAALWSDDSRARDSKALRSYCAELLRECVAIEPDCATKCPDCALRAMCARFAEECEMFAASLRERYFAGDLEPQISLCENKRPPSRKALERIRKREREEVECTCICDNPKRDCPTPSA